MRMNKIFRRHILRIAVGITMLAVIATGAAAGTDIDKCTTISSPGEYVLNTSIDNASTCIYITSSDVILDGAGYTINGTKIANTYGVYVYNSSITLTNVTVKNLKVTNWDIGIDYFYSQNGSVANNTASSNGFGIFLFFSSNNNTLTGNNASSNSEGIYLYSSSNNNLTGNNASSNSFTGIHLASSSDNNTLTSNNASSNVIGIFLAYSSDNNTLTGNNASSNSVGIELFYSSDNNLTGNKASNNTLWAFYSELNSINNTVINLTINPTISFTGKDVAITSASSPHPDPQGYKNISKFINATNNSEDSWLFLNVSDSDSDVAGLNEGSLRMWRYNGSAWSQVPDPNNVNTGQKDVYANITAFSIFAPMGRELPNTQAKVPALNPVGLVALVGALSFVAISRIRRRGK